MVVGMCIDKTVWDNIRVSWYDIDLIVSACVGSFQQEMLVGNTRTTIQSEKLVEFEL